jgi:hypothetical protein
MRIKTNFVINPNHLNITVTDGMPKSKDVQARERRAPNPALGTAMGFRSELIEIELGPKGRKYLMQILYWIIQNASENLCTFFYINQLINSLLFGMESENYTAEEGESIKEVIQMLVGTSDANCSRNIIQIIEAYLNEIDAKIIQYMTNGDQNSFIVLKRIAESFSECLDLCSKSQQQFSEHDGLIIYYIRNIENMSIDDTNSLVIYNELIKQFAITINFSKNGKNKKNETIVIPASDGLKILKAISKSFDQISEVYIFLNPS